MPNYKVNRKVMANESTGALMITLPKELVRDTKSFDLQETGDNILLIRGRSEEDLIMEARARSPYSDSKGNDRPPPRTPQQDQKIQAILHPEAAEAEKNDLPEPYSITDRTTQQLQKEARDRELKRNGA